MEKIKKPIAHLTFDLETLGNTSDAPPVQIGAVCFDPATGGFHDTFIRNIKWESLQELGLTPEFATVFWWLTSEKITQEARNKVFDQTHAIPILEALEKFGAWISELSEKYSIKCIWCHSGFDDPILRNVTKKANIKMPYEYWAISDIRTLKTIKGKPTIVQEGVAHDGLDDSVFQAEYIVELLGRPDKSLV